MKNMNQDSKKLLSIGEVAKIFGIHQDTLRNWEKNGILEPLRVGPRKDRRYRPEDIEKLAEKDMQGIISSVSSDKITLPQLKQFLWRSADILRGKIDSSDYKKYIFGLLFYKRINDVWNEEFQKVLEEFHDEDIAKADYNHRFQVPDDCRWSNIQNQAENIGTTLNSIFEKLTNVNSPKLDKVFDDLDFANKERFPNDTLQSLINHFSLYNFGDNYINSDLLGDAYEYLIEQFAADAGKKGGEFYTPREVEKIIINILKPHEKDHIYDPTVGSGGFLLEAYNYLRDKAGEKVAKTLYLYGQEINISTFAIAKINMFLHGLDSADIRRGDTLGDPQFINEKGALQTFDICVANPPYSIKEWAYSAFRNDKFGRTDGYATPPDKNADFAFLLHIIKSMNQNGRAGVVLPHGVLFRAEAEGKIREQIIKNDLIEGIISLPAKLFYGTKIPAIIMILNKNKSSDRKNKIIFIDAENEFETGKKQNKLRKADIQKIVEAFENYKAIPQFSEIVGVDKIIGNEFYLNIKRYVDTSKIETKVDLNSLTSEITDLEKALTDEKKKLSTLLSKEIKRGEWLETPLNSILFEHKEVSTGTEQVHSVSVKKGVVNQIEHLGRSYAAKDTSKYKLVKPGDIIYTKSPTGDFPYGIIKQSKLPYNAIVSPLYGVFTPINQYIGAILDAYFESNTNTNNYLQTIVSKGAKNTINISNTKFLSKSLYLPTSIEEQKAIAEIIESLKKESMLQEAITEKYLQKKRGVIQKILSNDDEV